MELLLIRHALPTTVDNRDTGREAAPDLSDLGRRPAAALAAYPGADVQGGKVSVYNSLTHLPDREMSAYEEESYFNPNDY